MSRWVELARGAERRIFAAHSRWVAAAKAKALPVRAVLRSWGAVQLIIPCARIRPMVRDRLRLRTGVAARPEHARVLCEHRRGNGGGKNYHGT